MLRRLCVGLATLFIVALGTPASAQSFGLPEIGIQSSGDCRKLAVRDRQSNEMVSIGCMSSGKWKLQPNTIEILGAGSTGDATLFDALASRQAARGKLGRAVFETMQGTTFLVRPYLSDLTCASDQNANILAALLDAPAGAAIAFPPGCIRSSGGLVNGSRMWVGAGTGDEGTEFQFTGTSGAGITLMGANAQLDNFRVTCTANRATSQMVGIQMSDGIENPRGQRVNRIRMKDCYDQIDVRSGEFWSISHFDMYRAARYGLRVRNLFNPDSGDGTLTAGAIYTDQIAGGKAAIRWESGGGFKVSGTKTLQFDRCFDMAIADGALTKILGIDASNSFENGLSGECIKVGRIEGGTTGNFSDINIEAQVSGSIAIYDGASHVKLSPVIGSSSFGVIIYGGDGINVSSATTMKNVDYGVLIRDPATNVTVGNFNLSGTNVAKVRDERTVGGGPVDRTDVRPLSLNPGASAPLWQATLPEFGGAEVSVLVQGIIQSSGGVNARRVVLVTRSGGPVQAVSVGNNDGGQPVTVTFDASTVPGAIRIGVSNPDGAAGHVFMGTAEVRVAGKTVEFKRL